MAFEGKKIDELKWVIASVFNRSFQISRAIKITGWLGVVLSILSIAYASVLFAFSPFGVILAIVAGLQAVPGVTFLIFNIFLLTRAGHEDSVTKIIRTGCYILSIFGFPISLLAIIGIVNSNKDLIKAYVIFLFVMMILSAFSWLGYVIQFKSWLFSGNIVCNLLWYRYIMNMYVIQINIM